VAGEEAQIRRATYIPAGTDRFRGKKREVFGSRVIDFKVSALDTNGGLSVSELIDVEKGGPSRHFHHAQEEWFYVAEGEYIIEVGDERYELGAGDSVLAPRKVEHVWAHVGEGRGRLIVALQPAGEIEEFFDDLAKLGSNPKCEELRRVFTSHGLELTGPPLSIE
jgi:mannose-6-phosphate isomerase-like protein (cupin superfamily)